MVVKFPTQTFGQEMVGDMTRFQDPIDGTVKVQLTKLISVTNSDFSGVFSKVECYITLYLTIK